MAYRRRAIPLTTWAVPTAMIMQDVGRVGRYLVPAGPFIACPVITTVYRGLLTWAQGWDYAAM